MTTVVCDASVLFKLLVAEEDSERARALASSCQLSAPELVIAEIGNALWSRARSGSFNFAAADLLIESFLRLPLDVRPLGPLIGRALAIADVLDHPVYDCVYLALAETLAVPLVTADERFLSAIGRVDLQTAEIMILREVT
jgi:predicted nucleic acid-binding protein